MSEQLQEIDSASKAISQIESGIRAILSIRDIWQDQRRRVYVKEILSQIRNLYFYDSYSKTLIQDLASGADVDSDRITDAWGLFESVEGSIRISLVHLRELDAEFKGQLPIQTRNLIAQIPRGKERLRIKVYELFHKMARGKGIDDSLRRECRDISAEIERLNKLLLEAEQNLMKGS